MDNTKATILIIEDNPVNMRLVQLVLMANNYTLLQATDGAQGLDMLNKHKEEINLIITDLQLPEIDGYEVLKIIKSNDDTKNIPVIVSSAHVMEEDVQKVKELGCTSFMPKPIDIDELLKSIEEILLGVVA